MTMTFTELTEMTSASPATSVPESRGLVGRAAFFVGFAIAGTAATFIPTSSTTLTSDVGWTPIVVSAASANPTSLGVPDRLRDLKERSGLTWGQLASAIGVSPRSLHYWINGGNVAPVHSSRLDLVAAQILAHDGGEPRQTRLAVTSSLGGRSLLDRLIAETRPERQREEQPDAILGSEDVANHQPGTVVAVDAVELPLKKI